MASMVFNRFTIRLFPPIGILPIRQPSCPSPFITLPPLNRIDALFRGWLPSPRLAPISGQLQAITLLVEFPPRPLYPALD